MENLLVQEKVIYEERVVDNKTISFVIVICNTKYSLTKYLFAKIYAAFSWEDFSGLNACITED